MIELGHSADTALLALTVSIAVIAGCILGIKSYFSVKTKELSRQMDCLQVLNRIAIELSTLNNEIERRRK